jgi:hypothetical protein
MLDYGVIVPRLQALYEWSARELGLPGVRELARDGNPIYAWSHGDRHVWRHARESLPMRARRVATSAPDPRATERSAASRSSRTGRRAAA